MAEEVRIAILMGVGTDYGRHVTLGVGMYARPARPWLFIATPSVPSVLPRLREWQPHGIIAHVGNPGMADMLLGLNVPLVNVSGAVQNLPCPQVVADDHAVGRLAAMHFIERGFKHYAFLGISELAYSAGRFEGYRQALTDAGLNCCAQLHYPLQDVVDVAGGFWSTRASELRGWLEQLPRPVAIFTAVDHLGFALGEICRESGIHVPEEVALLGVDDDEVACELAYPQLSSIRLPDRRIGFEAARILDQLLQGHRPTEQPLRLPPLGVTVRHSTEITAIEDAHTAAALRFIREHADQNIGVEDILRVVPCSRRGLERRFKSLLGRTILDEIRRVHVELAKKLLTEQSLSMAEVAANSGFSSASRMSIVFHELTGVSPSTYRKRNSQHR